MSSQTDCSVDVIAEFLEAAIHEILYCRGVYPRELFERRQLYRIPVHMSCHPELNSYIVDVIAGVKALLSKNRLEKLAIILSNKDKKPVENFTFRVVFSDGETLREDWHLLRVEMTLRDFILKISACESVLGPANEGCSFSVEVYTMESGALSLQSTQEEFPWVYVSGQASPSIESTILPLKSASTELFQMQLYVEH